MRLHQHDCERPDCCAYLGSTNRADVYLTRTEKLIVRESSSPSDYLCFDLETAKLHRHTLEWASAVALAERTLQ